MPGSSVSSPPSPSHLRGAARSRAAPGPTHDRDPHGVRRHATFTYAEMTGVDPNRISLDVYTPPATDGACADRPLVVWVHGGGWAGGDKAEFMEDKVPLFNGAGFVFASVNYRLTDETLVPPSPQYPVHNDDTAASLAWLVDHAEQIGADPEQIAVLGHSAGGGITAAISTDERYLGRFGLPLDTIGCAGSMDGEGYDVTAGATTSPPEWQPTYTTAFGTDPAVWADASPINHVAADKGIPDLLRRGTRGRLASRAAPGLHRRPRPGRRAVDRARLAGARARRPHHPRRRTRGHHRHPGAHGVPRRLLRSMILMQRGAALTSTDRARSGSTARLSRQWRLTEPGSGHLRRTRPEQAGVP